MASAAFQATTDLQAQPASGADMSGCQQAVSCSVIGRDAIVSPALPGAKIGAANIADAAVQWDGTIP